MANNTPIDVLFVEDSPADARLIQEAFRNCDSSIRLHLVIDGLEAMTFLRREGIYAKAPRPDLVLLDLKLPNMDGRELLALIKTNESWKSIPTIVLTTSETDADVWLSYKLQANCYLRKPTQWDMLDGIIKNICIFWLGANRVPRVA